MAPKFLHLLTFPRGKEALASLYITNIAKISEISNMKLPLRLKYFSAPRYNRYLASVGNDDQKAERLYQGNIQLSQAFQPLLAQFEIVLRNTVNDMLAVHFADPDWIINQKTGFMNHATLRPKFFLKESVKKAEDGLARQRVPLSSGKIIADQTLGFWVSLFSTVHYRLIAGQPIHIFPHKPGSEKRSSIHGRLEEIQKFRNRISHQEPICFTHNHIDCTRAVEVRKHIFDLVAWIDPDLVPFFDELDNIQNEIDQIMSI